MTIGTILKSLVALAGIITTLVLTATGLAKKDNKSLKRAGLIFLGTWAILILLGALEFLF